MSIARDLASGSGIEAGEVIPHIIPNVLYPAVAGKDLSGTALGGSYTYGTAHTDGRMYYYTDIKGSKPIKDPRIGGHFGSQRHMCKSLQSLEQETAIHGENVYSVDGREWIRVYGRAKVQNNDNGHNIQLGNDGTAGLGYCEIVGYFTTANLLTFTWSVGQYCNYDYKIDGGSWSAEQTTFQTGANSPLGTRYVDRGSVGTVVTGQTLGIHTLSLKIPDSGDTLDIYGIELIAQDKFTDATCDYNNDPTITHDANTRIVAGLTVTGTGIPANATVASVTSSTEFELSAATTGGAVTNGTLTFGTNNIQIPSQNVVSYGKKFTVSDNPHYDPFNGFVNDTTLFSSVVDTATSLGVGTATTWGTPWDKGSNDHIRPFNGGRVVKWVDSSGTIKTSVTMMPANAQNIGTDQSNEITTASATNSHTINFSDDAVDNSLSEVAKSFHWREFGNGSANQSTGGTSSAADFSQLANAEDDVAYVMDDGLTSMSGDDNSAHTNFTDWYTGGGDIVNITFIGTGISFEADPQAVHAGITNGVYAQNLPYGTHILKLQRSSPYDVWVDGVQLTSAATSSSDHIGSKFITFHQPKKPPIPEDAVVLADYMLMADFVAQGAGGNQNLSKGTRYISASRDILYNCSGTTTLTTAPDAVNYRTLHIDIAQHASNAVSVSAFGTRFAISGYNMAADAPQMQINDSNVTGVYGNGSTGGSSGISPVTTLGNNKFEFGGAGSDGGMNFDGMFIATPIHTSYHYQTFETPFLHELVGGDRNMEQTNLVVTPDGKTWDEITRDTSYIGNVCVVVTTDTQTTSHDWLLKTWNDWRGLHNSTINSGNKNFAIAYDRIICLVDGYYDMSLHFFSSDAINVSEWTNIRINGQRLIQNFQHDASQQYSTPMRATAFIKRGDYIQLHGACISADEESNRFEIIKLEK